MVVRQGSIVRARGERGRRRRRERDGSWARNSTRTRGLTTTRGRRRTVVGEGTIGDGTWESIRDDVETSVRDAVRRAHGVIDGGFEATVIDGDGGGRRRARDDDVRGASGTRVPSTIVERFDDGDDVRETVVRVRRARDGGESERARGDDAVGDARVRECRECCIINQARPRDDE